MPVLESEINFLEMFSGVMVIAITINPEDMTDIDATKRILLCEYKYKLPATNVIKYACDKLVAK